MCVMKRKEEKVGTLVYIWVPKEKGSMYQREVCKNKWEENQIIKLVVKFSE